MLANWSSALHDGTPSIEQVGQQAMQAMGTLDRQASCCWENCRPGGLATAVTGRG